MMDISFYSKILTLYLDEPGEPEDRLKLAMTESNATFEKNPEEISALMDFVQIEAPEEFRATYQIYCKEYQKKKKASLDLERAQEATNNSLNILSDIQRNINNGADLCHPDFKKAIEALQESIFLILPKESSWLNIMLAKDEKDSDIPERCWYIERLITNGLCLLSAKKGIGKSFFILQAAIQIANGEPFLGRKTIKSKVLYCVTELDRTAVHERLNSYRKEIPENLYIRYGWSNGDEGPRELELLFEEYAFSVVIIDMFSAVIPPNTQTNNYDLTPFLLSWRSTAHRLGICVVAVWHSSKSPREDFMDSPLGTTGLVGQSDCVLVLERKRNANKGILFSGGNHGEESTLRLWFENCLWSLADGKEETQECGPADIYILEYLRSIREGKTAPAIYAHFEETPKHKSQAAVRASLNRLKELRLVDKDGHDWFAITTEQDLIPNEPN